ncbi:MAG: hypothetical protein ACFBQW_09800 [Sphingomonadaceae bacterium]
MRHLLIFLAALALPAAALAQDEEEAPLAEIGEALEATEEPAAGAEDPPPGAEQEPGPEQAPAPQAPQQPSRPPCVGDEFRHFDFWIGTWEVRLPDGELAGTNRIAPVEGGCALRETWTGASGSSGQSLSFYNPAKRMWEQYWVSPGVFIELRGAIFEPGVVMMGGQIVGGGKPGAREFMGRWTLEEDGSVKQEFWERDAESGAWKDWFTGIYRKTG